MTQFDVNITDTLKAINGNQVKYNSIHLNKKSFTKINYEIQITGRDAIRAKEFITNELTQIKTKSTEEIDKLPTDLFNKVLDKSKEI